MIGLFVIGESERNGRGLRGEKNKIKERFSSITLHIGGVTYNFVLIYLKRKRDPSR